MIDYIIPQAHVEEAFKKEWGGTKKMSFYARSDGTSVTKATKTRLVGNLGEWAAYGAFTKAGIVCQIPHLDTVNSPDKKIWPDDLIFYREYTYKDKPILNHHSVKGQTYSIGKEFGISWLWQLKTYDRHEDPMVADPNFNCMFVSVQIDDSHFEPDRDMQCKVSAFYWPDIHKYLNQPKLPHLISKKKAIYLKDIEHLEIDYDLLQEQPVLA